MILIEHLWWMVPVFVFIALVIGKITSDTIIGRTLFVVLVTTSYVSILEWVKS